MTPEELILINKGLAIAMIATGLVFLSSLISHVLVWWNYYLCAKDFETVLDELTQELLRGQRGEREQE